MFEAHEHFRRRAAPIAKAPTSAPAPRSTTSAPFTFACAIAQAPLGGALTVTVIEPVCVAPLDVHVAVYVPCAAFVVTGPLPETVIGLPFGSVSETHVLPVVAPGGAGGKLSVIVVPTFAVSVRVWPDMKPVACVAGVAGAL